MGSTPRGISASRGAAVLGLSDWASPLEVWQLIQEERQPGYNAAHGYTLPEFKDGASLRWGLAFEDAVVSLSEEATGEKILHRERLFVSDLDGSPCDDGQITCHIDGAYDGPLLSPLILHEGKTTTAFAFREKWGEPGSDRIPQVYQVQVQHQMLCTGASEVIVSVLVFPEMPDEWEKMGVAVEKDGDLYVIRGPKLEDGFHAWTCSTLDWARPLARMGYFHQYRVKANPEAQAAMLAAYRDFWEHNVLGEVPPDPRDYEDVRRLFPAPKGTIVCDDTLAGWLREYKDIRDELGGKGMLSRRADELKVLILERARATDGTIDDESREKTIFRDQSGAKLGQYDGKTFRV
jgi:hypothetical protein